MQVERVSIESLKLDPKNARKHGPRNLEGIKRSLERFGQQKPIVVDENSQVIAGNGTLEAARVLGWTEILIHRTTLKDLEARAYSIADNQSGALAEWDEDALAEALAEIQREGSIDEAVTGFSPEEIERLIQEHYGTGEIVEDEVPEPPEDPVSRPGDLWILGDHRLFCGDSSKPDDVDHLLAGIPVHLVNTDPPYNVRVEPRSNNAIAAGLSSFQQTHHQKLDLERHPGKSKPTTTRLRPKDRPLENDFISDEDYARMLRAWFGNIARVLQPGRAFYIWGGYANVGNYPGPLAACGLYFSQAIIWVKEHPVLTRKDFMGNHEWCFYGWREGAAHQFYGPNNATDVWAVKKVNPQSMIHLTEKPVELAARAIQFSSRQGENVLDLFGGSGSTLIACEQLGRRGYLMEIDLAYADVIVERWQKFTGKEAALDDGRTFVEVAKERLQPQGA